MFRSRCLLFALAVAALAASVTVRPAGAAVPSAAESNIDAVIVAGTSNVGIVVGGGCGPAQAGYQVIVRDAARNGLPGVNVVLDFSATPIKLFNAQLGGITVNCPAKTLSKMTNASGIVTFLPKFGGFENTNKVEVHADGIVLGKVPARSTDIDAMGATTGLNDLAIFGNMFLMAIPNAEMNFDDCPPGAAVLGIADFAQFEPQYTSAAVGAYCP